MGWDLINKNNESNKNSIVIIGITILLLIILFGSLATYIGNVSEEKDMYDITSTSENSTYTIPVTLNVKDGAVEFESDRLNDTYLSCDGVNDYALIYPSSNDSLAFWYNSSTSEKWQFVVNVMGTQYTNGTLSDAPEYPVYWNNTHYFFCKTDATTFWEGSIDKISIYDGQLSPAEINTLYSQTRW